MTQPKLRKGAEDSIRKACIAGASDLDPTHPDRQEEEMIFREAVFWTLANLHKLLEPTTGEYAVRAEDGWHNVQKKVAIVEVEGE